MGKTSKINEPTHLPVGGTLELTWVHQVVKQHPILGKEEPCRLWYEMVLTTKCEETGLLAVQGKKKN